MLEMFDYPFDSKQSGHAREYEFTEFQLLVLDIRRDRIQLAELPKYLQLKIATKNTVRHLRAARHRAIDAAYEVSSSNPPLHEYLRYCDRAASMAKEYFQGREFVKEEYRAPEGV